MTIKVFKKKEPVVFEYDGHTFSLLGEIPIASQLRLVELQDKHGSEADVTKEDLLELYASLLGDESANKLINELNVGDETLQEILEWYMNQLAERKKAVKPNPKVVVKGKSR